MDTQDQRWAAATRMLATHLISIVGVAVASQRSLAVSSIPQGLANQVDLPRRQFVTTTCFCYERYPTI